MKILFVLNNFLPYHVAGTEIYTFSLAKELKAMGIHCKIVIPNYGKQENESYEIDGIKIIQYAEPSVSSRRLIMGKIKPDGLNAFIEAVKTEKPDIVHFQELAGGTGITLHHVLAAKKLNCKVVVTFHVANYSCLTGNLLYKDKQPCDGAINIKKCSACYLNSKKLGVNKEKSISILSNTAFYFNLNTTRLNNSVGSALGIPFIVEALKKRLNELIKNSDKVIVITKWYKQVLLNNGITSKKIGYIPQGLPFNFRENTLISNPAKPLKIVFVGRISHYKGIHLLLDALKDISQNEVTLDIFGQTNDQPYYDFCLNKSKELRNVRWKGLLDSSQVINTLKNYDLFCLPSTFSEMSPLVIQEAFAAMIPVLASNVPGNSEQIKDDENGWLFKFQSSDSLRESIIRLIKNPNLINTARQKLPIPISFSEIARQYQLEYENLLS